MELNFRTLHAEEIDVRVGTSSYNEKEKKGGCSLLLYKDARVDMALLDEVCKPFGWCREHKELKGVCYCGVGIKDTDTGEWVYKWDAGAESFTEKEKGEASDSFKRACVNWGIGRELYTAGFIWVELGEKDFYFDDRERKWKMQKNIKFSVREIHVDEKRQIDKLIIVDQREAVVHSKQKDAYLQKSEKNAPKPKSNMIIPKNVEKPAEEPKMANAGDNNNLTAEQLERYLQLCSDLDNAQTFQQVSATVSASIGEPYEQRIRDRANGICKLNGWGKKQ